MSPHGCVCVLPACSLAGSQVCPRARPLQAAWLRAWPHSALRRCSPGQPMRPMPAEVGSPAIAQFSVCGAVLCLRSAAASWLAVSAREAQRPPLETAWTLAAVSATEQPLRLLCGLPSGGTAEQGGGGRRRRRGCGRRGRRVRASGGAQRRRGRGCTRTTGQCGQRRRERWSRTEATMNGAEWRSRTLRRAGWSDCARRVAPRESSAGECWWARVRGGSVRVGSSCWASSVRRRVDRQPTEAPEGRTHRHRMQRLSGRCTQPSHVLQCHRASASAVRRTGRAAWRHEGVCTKRRCRMGCKAPNSPLGSSGGCAVGVGEAEGHADGGGAEAAEEKTPWRSAAAGKACAASRSDGAGRQAEQPRRRRRERKPLGVTQQRRAAGWTRRRLPFSCTRRLAACAAVGSRRLKHPRSLCVCVFSLCVWDGAGLLCTAGEGDAVDAPADREGLFR